jgi:hypothetical protein
MELAIVILGCSLIHPLLISHIYNINQLNELYSTFKGLRIERGVALDENRIEKPICSLLLGINKG